MAMWTAVGAGAASAEDPEPKGAGAAEAEDPSHCPRGADAAEAEDPTPFTVPPLSRGSAVGAGAAEAEDPTPYPAPSHSLMTLHATAVSCKVSSTPPSLLSHIRTDRNKLKKDQVFNWENRLVLLIAEQHQGSELRS